MSVYVVVFCISASICCCLCGFRSLGGHGAQAALAPILPIMPKIPVDFHEFPCHPYRHDEDGNRGGKTPTIKIPRQVSYRLRFHRTKRSGARASRHPPRWRAQLDIPARRDEGGELGSGSSSIRRFPFGPRQPHTIERRVRQWHADSEVKATTRWTQRAGSRSRPLFAVCLNPQIPIGNPEKRQSW